MDPAPNPYAAPDEKAQVAVAPVRTTDLAKGLPEAIAALDRHLADPVAVAADRAHAGGRLTLRTWIPAALVVAGAVAAVGCFSAGRDAVGFGVAASIVGGISLIIALVNLVGELGLVQRQAALTPDAAALGWLKAIRMGRGGYVLACLSPTARAQEVAVPALAPVVTGGGTFMADSAKGLKRWIKTFARAGTGQVRWMKIHGVRVVRQDGDVAEVEARIRFQSWPNWANIVSVVLFLLIRIIGIVIALILFYSLRKRLETTVTKILLRGRDGAWYLFQPGLDDAAG